MKKFKFLMLIILSAVILTGCPDPNNDRHCSEGICFQNYSPTYFLDDERIIDKGEKLEVQVDFSGVEGAKSYKIVSYKQDSSGRRDYEISGSKICKKISEDDSKNQIILLPTQLSYGQKVFVKVSIFSDGNCKDLIASATSHKTTITEESQLLSEYEDVFDSIGGKLQYCNVDGNGNYNLADYTDNLVVKIAYSQVGYHEKNSKNYIESCKVGNGNRNYQKYGENGMDWDVAFIHWVLEKANVEKKIREKVPKDVDSIKAWAAPTNRPNYYFGSHIYDNPNIRDGDLVIITRGRSESGFSYTVGIAYKEADLVIIGDYPNSVVAKPYSEIKDLVFESISMHSIAY